MITAITLSFWDTFVISFYNYGQNIMNWNQDNWDKTVISSFASVKQTTLEQIKQRHTSYSTMTLFTSLAEGYIGHTADRQTVVQTELLSIDYQSHINGWNELRNGMSMVMSLVEGASAHCEDINGGWCHVPTCTGSLILNRQVFLFLTSGLLQLALVAVVFAIWATNLQESHEDDYTVSRLTLR